MAGNVTGKERMIDLECASCGTTYQEPDGFVGLVRKCSDCTKESSKRFWKAYDEGRVPTKDAFRILLARDAAAFRLAIATAAQKRGPMYGMTWKFASEEIGPTCRRCSHVSCREIRSDIMVDELGHKRHADHVPCFLGGRLHSYRYLGDDVRHCVLRGIHVCVYDGREKQTKPTAAN
jgi:hypothetical protein